MKSLLRYRLAKLRDKYKNETIPWELASEHPDAGKLVAEMIIGKSFPVMEIVMDYPDIPHKGKIYQRITELATDIDIRILSRDTIEHLVMIAAYKLALRYIERGHIGNLYRFMAGNLPLYYVRELERELGKNDINYQVSGREDKTEVFLPDSPEEYLKTIKEMGVGSYVDSFSFYNRTHFYRIINRKNNSQKL